MADFDDISGWRDEFDEFIRNGTYDCWNQGDEDGCSIRKPIPISNVYQCMELVLKYDDLKDCIMRINDWYREDPERTCIADDDDENKTFPYDANGVLIRFYSWYCITAGIGPNSDVFGEVDRICKAVEVGYFPSLKSQKIKDHLKESCNRDIDWGK